MQYLSAICAIFAIILHSLVALPQQGMQQMQEEQSNQVGGGMGLNLGLGFNGGMFNRNQQMRNRAMGLAANEPRKPGCHGWGPRPPPPPASTTAAPTNGTNTG